MLAPAVLACPGFLPYVVPTFIKFVQFPNTPKVATWRKEGPYRYYLLKSKSIQGPYSATSGEFYDTEFNSTDWRLEGKGRTVWRWDDMAVVYLPDE